MMLRITLVALAFAGACALDIRFDVRAKTMLRAEAHGDPEAEKKELDKELEDLQRKVAKKEEREDQSVKAKKEALKQRIDEMIAEEKKEDKLNAEKTKKIKAEIKQLRQRVAELKGDAKVDGDTKSSTGVPEGSKVQAPDAPEKVSKVPEAPHRIPELTGPEAHEVPEVFPVPTTSRCIVIICCQYIVIYTALAVCRTLQDFAIIRKGQVEDTLRAAAQTLTYGPMLCVLFIACRMRVEFLSDGKDQPQAWVQSCMYALTYAVLASTLLVLAMPLVTGKPLPIKEGTCDLEKPEMSDSPSQGAFYALTAARYLILVGMYGGIAGVIFGICIYRPPGATDLSKLPAPAPAVMCTMILAVAFFSMQLIIAACRTYTEFQGVEFPKIIGAMKGAATTMEFAPMLCILFLAARMRALQHDSQPQPWAQNCMYGATLAICLTALLAVVVPFLMAGTRRENVYTKEVTFEVPESKGLGLTLIALRYICLIGFYGCAAGVAVSIFLFEAPGGAEATLPVSPTVQCVVNLTCQFFFVYGMMTIMLTVSEITGGKIPMETYRLFWGLDAAKSTLAFAPMLAILFVTTRMYALLITDNKGAPPAWVQDGMYMATWSLCISFLSCLLTGLIMGKVETDSDGNVTNKFPNKCIAMSMSVIRYLCMVMLYGGMIIVVVGLFVMTPETANGRGSVPYLTDAVDATPVGKPPPQPTEPLEVGQAAGKQMAKQF